MKIARFLAACFGALFVAAGVTPAAAASTAGPIVYCSGATFDTSTPKFGAGALNASCGYSTGGVDTVDNGTQAFTHGEWIKITAAQLGGYNMLGGVPGVWFWFVDGNGHLNSNINISGTVNVADGGWHWVELDVDATSAQLSVGGVVDATVTGDLRQYINGNLDVGNWNNGSYIFKGEIDNSAFWIGKQHTGNFTVPGDYTGSEGMAVLYRLNSASDTGNIVDSPSVETAAAASSYTASGPSSGSAGAASNAFTLTANGALTAAVTVTPSAQDGTFNPSTVTLPASSSPTASFTYTPASAGTKAISFTNGGGLSNPSSLSYSASAPLVFIPPSSAAFHFSPANWQCLGSRSCAPGVTNPRSNMAGAYFCVAWNASSSPTAVLQIPTNTQGGTLSYFLNGSLTQNVSGTSGPITLSGLKSNAVNQLMVVQRSVPNGDPNWGQTGAAFHGVEVDGLAVDGASSAGVAPTPCQPSGDATVTSKGWTLLQGDSIDIGFTAAANGDTDFLVGPFWTMAQTLFQQGYDVGSTAVPGTGALATAISVPGLYNISSSGYQAASSRWNLVDANVSMLDTNGHISGWGGVGQEPALILTNVMTNEANGGYPLAYVSQSLTGLWTAQHAAAPAAKMIAIPGFPTSAGTSNSQYRDAMASAAASYGAGVTYADFGTSFTAMVYSTNGYHLDAYHPTYAADGFLGAKMLAVVQAALNPAGGTTVTKPPFRLGFH